MEGRWDGVSGEDSVWQEEVRSGDRADGIEDDVRWVEFGGEMCVFQNVVSIRNMMAQKFH